MRKAGTGEGRKGDRPQLSEAQVRHLITQVHLSPIDVGMRGPRSASPDRPGLFTQYPNRGHHPQHGHVTTFPTWEPGLLLTYQLRGDTKIMQSMKLNSYPACQMLNPKKKSLHKIKNNLLCYFLKFKTNI